VGHTSFLLLQCQLGPVRLHSIPQSHPKLCLLLWRHSLPSLFNVRERRIRDCMSGCESLLCRNACCRSCDYGGAPGQRAGDGAAEHLGSGEVQKRE
jgi:hypothetical protein